MDYDSTCLSWGLQQCWFNLFIEDRFPSNADITICLCTPPMRISSICDKDLITKCLFWWLWQHLVALRVWQHLVVLRVMTASACSKGYDIILMFWWVWQHLVALRVCQHIVVLRVMTASGCSKGYDSSWLFWKLWQHLVVLMDMTAFTCCEGYVSNWLLQGIWLYLIALMVMITCGCSTDLQKALPVSRISKLSALSNDNERFFLFTNWQLFLFASRIRKTHFLFQRLGKYLLRSRIGEVFACFEN